MCLLYSLIPFPTIFPRNLQLQSESLPSCTLLIATQPAPLRYTRPQTSSWAQLLSTTALLPSILTDLFERYIAPIPLVVFLLLSPSPSGHHFQHPCGIFPFSIPYFFYLFVLLFFLSYLLPTRSAKSYSLLERTPPILKASKRS